MEVLVVDDDLDVLALVQLSLEREGFDVTAASSGAGAIALARAHQPDLAILDVRLADMSGLDLLAELRRLHPHIHVMMLSGAASEADRVLGLVSGADDYIVKPFSPRELAARVHALARRKGITPRARSRAVKIADADSRIQSFNGEGHSHGEVLQRTHDGNAVLVRSSTMLLRDGAGDPVDVVSVNRPITDDATTAPDVTIDLDDDIRNAAVSGELVVHYQPVVWLDDGAIGGVEALVRWRHPVRGLLSPADFIPDAERSGAIIDVGRVVMRHACEQARQWRDQGLDLHVAVNLSARQLTDDHLVDELTSIMEATATPPDRLWLEVTETSLVQDLDMATAVLQRLDTIGARVAIDDFGTGWASLTYLREFTVHALKIDRGFVRGLGTGTRDDAIVSSTISLARELDIAVIAEGIESEVQRSRLRDLGCVIGQGYLFGRPEAADVLDLDRARSIG